MTKMTGRCTAIAHQAMELYDTAYDIVHHVAEGKIPTADTFKQLEYSISECSSGPTSFLRESDAVNIKLRVKEIKEKLPEVELSGLEADYSVFDPALKEAHGLTDAITDIMFWAVVECECARGEGLKWQK